MKILPVINLILIVALIIYIIVKSIGEKTSSSFENKDTLKDSFGNLTYTFTTDPGGEEVDYLLTTTDDGRLSKIPMSQITDALDKATNWVYNHYVSNDTLTDTLGNYVKYYDQLFIQQGGSHDYNDIMKYKWCNAGGCGDMNTMLINDGVTNAALQIIKK